MPTDTNLPQLVINELTKALYDALTPVVNQLYLTPDTTATDIATAVSTHNQSIAAHANLLVPMQDLINNLKNIGRFLSIWNASTGSPTSEPTSSPYTYKVGDYYRVGTAGTKNPAPNATYIVGGVNWVEGVSLGVGDVIYCSNLTETTSTWVKQGSSGGGTVLDVTVDGTSVLSGGIAAIDLATPLSLKEAVANKVTTISSSSSDTEYPSAKCTYDAINNYHDSTKQNVIDSSNKLPYSLISDTPTIPTKTSDLIDDTATNPVDKADTLTNLTATVAELNYTDGVTSNIQTQLNNKSTVSVSDTGTATDEVSYITIDGTEKKISGGAAWGAITGTLTDQTDLTTALNAKADKSQLDDVLITATAYADAQRTKAIETSIDYTENALTLVDTATSTKYRLVVTNGVLGILEVSE